MTDLPNHAGRHRLQWLRDIVTDDTGVNFTPDKVAFVLGFSTFLCLAVWAVVVNKEHFDFQGFGGGFGVLVAGGGAGMWAASRQKPSGGGQ